ncbi:hypothetical protein [Methanosaeta sp. UBA356]|jgi:hypothetical protein|uniref:hypothetical protein n=1 Tax=Methanosaeta sp. UBA356 TaxID=1915559 RepID=UPI00257B24EA|nr:hypothetical protein [Methanosaeta sp. UBA356]
MTVMKFNRVRIERIDDPEEYDDIISAIKEQRENSKITQIKLMNFGNDNMKKPEERRNYKREAALEQLRETLGRESIFFSDPEHPDNEIENELAQIKMKLNSSGRTTLEQARAQLRRTQSLLNKRRL